VPRNHPGERWRRSAGPVTLGAPATSRSSTPRSRSWAARPQGPLREGPGGQLPHFTGIASADEAPERPEVCIDTTALPAGEAVGQLLATVAERGTVAGRCIRRRAGPGLTPRPGALAGSIPCGGRVCAGLLGERWARAVRCVADGPACAARPAAPRRCRPTWATCPSPTAGAAAAAPAWHGRTVGTSQWSTPRSPRLLVWAEARSASPPEATRSRDVPAVARQRSPTQDAYDSSVTGSPTAMSPGRSTVA